MKNETSSIAKWYLVLSFSLAGCALAPTRIYEGKPTFEANQKTSSDATLDQSKDVKGVSSSEPEASVAKSSWRLEVPENVILIDARPAFESSISSPPQAIKLWWEDFCQKTPPFEGRLEKDLYFHTRRIARMGISQDSEVWVMGRGLKGSFEEGRMAWILKRMGISKVRFLSSDRLKWSFSQEAPPPRAEVSSWKPPEETDLEISRTGALAMLKRKNTSAWVVDVRPANQYLKADVNLFRRHKLATITINIPWTEFLNELGEIQNSVMSQLEAVGLGKTSPIFVIDEVGEQASGVVLVLKELGYTDVRLWQGGYREWRK